MSLKTEYQGKYAEYYDLIYGGRDIAADCRRANELLAAAPQRTPARRLLDFGCGTGLHAFRLAEDGWDVVGVDIAPQMIQRCRDKLTPGVSSVRFHCAAGAGLAKTLGADQFDAAVSLFNVFNCMSCADEMHVNLEDLRALLLPGGLLMLELWNGSAVLADGPRVEHKVIHDEHRPWLEVNKTITPTLDKQAQRCRLAYRCEVRDQRAGSTEIFDEAQVVFFLTLEQYRSLFARSGFEVLKEGCRTEPDKPATVNDWYVCYLLKGT